MNLRKGLTVIALATTIDGREVAGRVRSEVAAEVAELRRLYGRPPGLAVVLVGDDPASHSYVRGKEKAAAEVSLYSEVHRLPAATTTQALVQLVEQLGRYEPIDGILVQLPLPAHVDERLVLAAVPAEKDVDGLGEVQAGRLALGLPGIRPCTPAGVMQLLRAYGVDLQGREAVVIGRSRLVGRPMAQLLLLAGATVTIAHSKTQNLSDVTRRADVLIAAAGRPGLVGPEHVRPGATVIDVGTTRVDGRLRGDVQFDAVAQIAGRITPVPGGVGPMTIAMLLRNAVEAMTCRLSPLQNSPAS